MAEPTTSPPPSDTAKPPLKSQVKTIQPSRPVEKPGLARSQPTPPTDPGTAKSLEKPTLSWIRTCESILVGVFALAQVTSLLRIGAVVPAVAVSVLTVVAVVLGSVEQDTMYLVHGSYTRPLSNSGVAHGALLLPLVLSAKFCNSYEATGQYPEFLQYYLLLSLAFGASLLANMVVPKRRSELVYALTFLATVCPALVGINYYLGPDTGRFIHSLFATILFQAAVHSFLWLFKQSFTVGEAAVVTQMLALLTMDFIALTTFRFRFFRIQLPQGLFVEHNEVHIFLLALVLGMILIGVLLSPALFLTKRALLNSGADHSKRIFGYPPKAILLSAIFYLGAAAIVFIFISPWVGAFLHENPFVWTFNFATSETKRLLLSLFWLVAVVASIIVFNMGGIYDQIAQKSSRVPLILVRKYFHVLAVIMFFPGYLLEPYFMQLAFGVAISAMMLFEYLRYFMVPPFGTAINSFMIVFVDTRDSGPVILSHMYLLLGCALPIWLASVPTASYFAPFSGILVLGIGDTMASVVGVHYGRIKWPGTSKSLEGTIAGIASMIMLSRLLYHWCPPELQLAPVQWGFVVLGLILAGLLEAFTKQIDNLIVPLYLFSLLNLV